MEPTYPTNPRPGSSRGYLVALLLIGAAAGLGRLLTPVVGPVPPTLIFPTTLLLAAGYGGREAGLMATVLGGALLQMFFPNAHTLKDYAGPLLFWVLYGTVASVLVGRLNESRRIAEEAARALAWKEAERRRYAQRLEEMDQNKDRFLDELAHEFRNHLNPIGMVLPMLKISLPGEPRVQRLYGTAERQFGLLVHLIDDLMDVAQIAEGKVALQLRPLDLTELVAHAAEDQQMRVEAAGLALVTKLPPHPVIVEGDPTRLVQVLTNLISNAVKFTDPGGTVTLWVSQLPDSLTVAIGVRDTGIGIEPKELTRIFGRFYQANRSGDRPRGGLGLGLDTVRRLVELHRGTVQVHSRGRGHGAEFVCLLPLFSDSGERRFDGTLRNVQEVIQ